MSHRQRHAPHRLHPPLSASPTPPSRPAICHGFAGVTGCTAPPLSLGFCITHEEQSVWLHPNAADISKNARRSHGERGLCSGLTKKHALCNNKTRGGKFLYCHLHGGQAVSRGVGLPVAADSRQRATIRARALEFAEVSGYTSSSRSSVGGSLFSSFSSAYGSPTPTGSFASTSSGTNTPSSSRLPLGHVYAATSVPSPLAHPTPSTHSTFSPSTDTATVSNPSTFGSLYRSRMAPIYASSAYANTHTLTSSGTATFSATDLSPLSNHNTRPSTTTSFTFTASLDGTTTSPTPIPSTRSAPVCHGFAGRHGCTASPRSSGFCSSHTAQGVWLHPRTAAISRAERKSHAEARLCSGVKADDTLCNIRVGVAFGYCHHHYGQAVDEGVASEPEGFRLETFQRTAIRERAAELRELKEEVRAERAQRAERDSRLAAQRQREYEQELHRRSTQPVATYRPVAMSSYSSAFGSGATHLHLSRDVEQTRRPNRLPKPFLLPFLHHRLDAGRRFSADMPALPKANHSRADLRSKSADGDQLSSNAIGLKLRVGCQTIPLFRDKEEEFLAAMSNPFGSVYGKVVLGMTISGLALSVGILVACAYLAFFSSARTHLDRVNFRLLVYALVSQYEILVSSHPSRANPFILLFSGSIFFCVALNLMLVLDNSIWHPLFFGTGGLPQIGNPNFRHPSNFMLSFFLSQWNGRMMEKYYIIGSLVLSGACVASACAAGRLGLDTKNHVCWYNNENEAEMLRWVIGTQVVWLLLLSVAELGVFIIILLHLLPFIVFYGFGVPDAEQHAADNRDVERYHFAHCSALSLYPLEEQEEAVPVSKTACSMKLMFSTYEEWSTGSPWFIYFSHAELFYLTHNPRPTGLVIYAARPLVYSIIAATDPSFIRALQARHTTASGSLSAAQRTTQVPPSVCLTTFVDLTSESTHGGESNHLGIGIGIQTQLENSFNQTESTLGVSLMAEKADDVGDEIHGVGVAKPVAALSSAAQWDIARHI
ncbi:hypothetical protein FB45DRAFT_865912 [Roridomyces roridus]|uniref:Transmembrane protein n=1 Tax=Roridomyces roridus TaxID=1738132 RepID=A0AAD7FRT5_9AGAR|nr:hypothetical protein FB45DRAFT_865912 [Roridomyces roridus]